LHVISMQAPASPPQIVPLGTGAYSHVPNSVDSAQWALVHGLPSAHSASVEHCFCAPEPVPDPKEPLPSTVAASLSGAVEGPASGAGASVDEGGWPVGDAEQAATASASATAAAAAGPIRRHGSYV
jgi:hypothetical protein